MKRLNLVGSVFNRLTVLKDAGNDPWGNSLWFCLCKCGESLTLPAPSFRWGNTKSCGCLNRETVAHYKHGHCPDDKPSPTYRTWQGMKTRCTNPQDKRYPSYGGANPPVTVCPEWMTFEGFLKSMGGRPEGTSLGRFCDLTNYEPEGCVWMTHAEQELSRKNKQALLKWMRGNRASV